MFSFFFSFFCAIYLRLCPCFISLTSNHICINGIFVLVAHSNAVPSCDPASQQASNQCTASQAGKPCGTPHSLSSFMFQLSPSFFFSSCSLHFINNFIYTYTIWNLNTNTLDFSKLYISAFLIYKSDIFHIK